MIWSYWPIAIGTLIVLFTLGEVFRDLFHPSATGSLSDFVASGVFRVFRHIPGNLSNAGPLSIVLVIFAWALLVCIGFALIYWPIPAQSFKASGGGGSATGFLPMVYFSLEVMTTLGLGDYAPVPTWLRLLVTFEALIGFAILSASVSSIVLVHPAVGRLRTTARRVSLVHRSEREIAFLSEDAKLEHLLESFAFDVIQARVDLLQHPIVYYFYADKEHSSFPETLPYLSKLSKEGRNKENAGVRRSANLLHLALTDLAEVLRARFLAGADEDYDAVFDAYQKQHQQV